MNFPHKSKFQRILTLKITEKLYHFAKLTKKEDDNEHIYKLFFA